MFLMGSIVLAPTLAMGIAQQDPANPATPPQHQLQQEQEATWAQPKDDVIGVIAEVREDSFSVRKDSDQSLVWFSITPELKSSYSGELVTGNHVRVAWMPGDSADKMMASSISAEGEAQADAETEPAEPAVAETDVKTELDTEADADLDVAVDEDSASATLDTDNDTTIADADADNELREDSDTYDADSDELPSTASTLPLIASLGLLALIGGAVVAFARRF
jgi:hypothetical protein